MERRYRQTASIAAFIIGLAASASVHAEGYIFVNDDAPAGGDGQSWATAYKYLQDALAAARNSGGAITEIWVAAGTYLPDHDAASPGGTMNRSASFQLIEGVAIRGGFAGDEDPATFDLGMRNFAIRTSILSGDLLGNDPNYNYYMGDSDNSFGVVTASGVGATAILDGFVVCGAESYGQAGAIRCSSASPTILNNTITGNYACGVWCSGGSPTIAHNTITANILGGVCCISSSATVSNNVIRGNIAYSSYDVPQMSGGVYCSGGSPSITDNVILDNTVSGSGASGGGICCYSSAARIANNFISGNSTRTYGLTVGRGGGIACEIGSPAVIINNTIVNNTADDGGGIYCDNSSLPTLANNIVAFNSSGIRGPLAATLSHNCVHNPGGYDYSVLGPGAGDISADPQLAALSSGNLHLTPGSPCIDAGDDAAVLAGWPDIDDEARIQNGHVDIGADEFNEATLPAVPTAIHVSPSGNDSADGLSWATAKLTVQASINAAFGVSGEVWVAAGTYHERIGLKPGVRLYGGFAGTETALEQRDWTAHAAILDGDAGGSVATVWCGYRSGALDGFTIRNGTGTAFGADDREGGGILFTSEAAPVVRHCTITGNSATYGGGLECVLGADPLISDCTISGNTASYGGGVYSFSGRPTITGCIISDNIGGGIGSDSYSGLVVTGNVIRGNRSPTGGGINCVGSGNGWQGLPAIITNNVIWGNTATSGNGGGILCSSGVTLANNLIAGNVAGLGGGIAYSGDGGTIANNTLIENNAAAGSNGGGIYCTGAPKISNNVVAFNSSGIYAATTATLRNNCVHNPGGNNYTGISAGTGDISTDPLLLAGDYGDVHLAAGSPCIDTGYDTVVQTSWLDLDGQARVQNGHVDIGADEFTGTTPGFVPNAIRVSPTGSDTNDGATWASAKLTVQAAINAASQQPVTEVWVAAGTYNERIVLKAWTHVFGGFAGTETARDQRDWAHNVSILDGGAAGSVVSATSYGHSSGIDGLTIRNGTGTSNYGGGISCAGSSPTIAHNTITANRAVYGAGVACTSNASPAIRENTITANTGAGTSNFGGGIYCSAASPTITGNAITDNKSSRGGGIYCDGNAAPLISDNLIAANGPSASMCLGGGISSSGASPTIMNNLIVRNSAGTGPGGGINLSGPSATVRDCTIAGNAAGVGGGAYLASATGLTFVDNLVIGNKATSRSGGLYTTAGSVINCVFSGNSAPGAAAVQFGSSGSLTNSILWGNGGPVIQGTPVLTYCAVEGGWSGIGNTDLNPRFVRDPSPGIDGTWGTADDDYGDLHLRPGSPCIDAGSNTAVPASVLLDLDGHSRFRDEPAVEDCVFAPGACGTAPIVDMGAYEFIRGDLDYDGDVDGDDLGMFTTCMSGPAVACSQECRKADFDGDADVDQDDFGAFQQRFGRAD